MFPFLLSVCASKQTVPNSSFEAKTGFEDAQLDTWCIF